MVLFLLLTSLARIGVAASCDLKVEEAYYWCYSQHLAPGYFDHPPMVAWLIALFSPLGHHPVWVRLPAILLFAGSAWLIFDTLKRLWNDRVALAGLWLHSLLPAFHWYSLMMLPDAPLMFFWSLGIWATTRLIQEERPQWWWLIGVATGLGMDSKYPALLIPLGAFLACWFLGKPRRLWLGMSMWVGALLALLLFSPVIYWNTTHDFASFRFQGSERFQEVTSIREKMASLIYPALMLGPLIYLASPLVLYWAGRARSSSALQGLCWTMPFLALMLWVSSQRLVNINWPLPGYLGFLLLLAPWMVQSRWRWLLTLPSGVFALFPLVAMAWPLALTNSADDVTQWQPMVQEGLRLQRSMPRPQETFFLGYGYQCASQLAYGGVGLDRILSVNALGMRALAYDYWTPPYQMAGWDALIVSYCRIRSNGEWAEQVQTDERAIRAHFQSLEGPWELRVDRGGKPLRLYRYWKGYNYRPQ